jgi:UDP-glucose 4-epimerase
LKQGMVSIFLAQALRTGQIVVKGSPERFRDFIHIDDVVAAFSRGLVHETDGAEVFNIGTGRRVLIGSLLEQLQELLPGTEVEIAGSTPGDQFGIYADTSHAERRLGFKAKVRLEDGLASMVARCRDAESLGG